MNTAVIVIPFFVVKKISNLVVWVKQKTYLSSSTGNSQNFITLLPVHWVVCRIVPNSYGKFLSFVFPRFSTSSVETYVHEVSLMFRSHFLTEKKSKIFQSIPRHLSIYQLIFLQTRKSFTLSSKND